MKLQIGERLPGTGPPHQPGGYVVTDLVQETPWFGLYAGKKIFYNFDFTGKRPRETDDKEWLDVYLRALYYPHLDDAGYVSSRREQARTEARRILASRSSNLWPEPLEVLELHNTRDPFTFARSDKTAVELEPVLVFARPQGQTLDEWQQNVLPLSALLGVLAELLEFMRRAHDEGLLLNGLNPKAVIVDRAERVHYIGSDMVVELAADGDGRGVRRPRYTSAQWRRLFPPERYARGYVPPECVQPGSLPDVRSDLYAWGALAYSLLSGNRPEKMAQQRESLSATFDEVALGHLDAALRTIPTVHVRNWGEQLGVDGAALLQDWPANLLAVFRLLLSGERERRPRSVVELRSWLLAPPPPPLAAAVAVRTAATEARLFLDLRTVDTDVEVVVRRGMDAAPETADAGDAVFEGPPRSPLTDPHVPTAGGVHYSLFTRKRRRQGWSVSRPVFAELLEPHPAALQRIAEAEAGGEEGQPEPLRIALLFQALDTSAVAEALLGSPLATVRGWAIARLASMLELPPPAEALLWRALRDPAPSLRLTAARGMLAAARPLTLDFLRRVLERLAGADIDEAIRAAQTLGSPLIPADLMQQVLAALEQERPTNCPECGVELAGRDRATHLTTAHGYVDLDGALLPRAEALTRLWDRVFLHADATAHRRLVELFAGLGNGEPARPGEAYTVALEAELARLLPSSGELPRIYVEHLVRAWRADPHRHALLPPLLRARSPLAREAGRELLLPELAEHVRGDQAKPADLRRHLDRLLAGDDFLEEKILLCLRLPHLGVSLDLANACIAQLQDERPITCPECKQRVRLLDLEAHLRTAHGIFEYRGVRRSYHDTRDVLLESVCGASPDFAAWRTLAAIAHERYGAQADRKVAHWLTQKLRSLEREPRLAAAAALAEAITATGSDVALIPQLARPQAHANAQAVSRLLALEIVARMSPPIPRPLMDAMHPLLADRQIPRAARQGAVAGLLRTTGKSGPAARAVLRAYVAESGKLRAIDKLHALEQRVGQVPEIDALCSELEDQVRMNCPRCGIELQRAAMVEHLWERHRLVLEGRRVREPWRVIEDWIEDYRLERDAAVLERCRDLARKLEGDAGLERVQRLLLGHGVEDRDALVALRGQARRKHASLCPHCFHQVPVPEVPALPTLTFVGDRLEGDGYRVEISEGGLVPWLEIQTPRGIVYEGGEPDRRLTRNGALLFFVLPIAVVAFLLTEMASGWTLPLWVALAVAVGAALFVGGFIYLLWPTSLNVRDRLVDLAWSELVPRLQQEGLTAVDADIVAALAERSAELGHPELRAEVMDSLHGSLENLARKRGEFSPHLAAVTRLQITDQLAEGEDVLPLVTNQVGQCFDARLPLEYASRLLDDFPPSAADEDEASATARRKLRPRLRVLLCDRAFTVGLHAADLVELGRASGPLGIALAVEDVEALAQRRHIWSHRGARPWERCGPARHCFELAADPDAGEAILAEFPDLLLAPRDLPIFICARGLWLIDSWIDRRPRTIEIQARRSGDDSGYHLLVDSQRFFFTYNPEDLAEKLERWCRWYFGDFLTQVEHASKLRQGDVIRRLLTRNGVACPDCRQRLIPRLGDVGVTLERKPSEVSPWVTAEVVPAS